MSIEKVLTADARYKVFKEKIKKLGYIKQETAKVKRVMEKTADFGMMSDAGNVKIARAVAQAKNEKDLRDKIEKISKMAGGKYSEAQEDEVINRALDALASTARGTQLRPDANVLMQLKSIEDTGRDTEVRTDDMKKTKVKAADAVKVKDALLSVKAPIRDKYLRLLQKDASSFKKTFDAILKVVN